MLFRSHDASCATTNDQNLMFLHLRFESLEFVAALVAGVVSNLNQVCAVYRDIGHVGRGEGERLKVKG